MIASVGTTGYSYDNGLAEMVNGLYKSEVIPYLKESWNGVNDIGWTGLTKHDCIARLVICCLFSLKNVIMIIYPC